MLGKVPAHSVSLCTAYLAQQVKPSLTSVCALAGGSIAFSIHTTVRQTLSLKIDSGRRDAFTAQEPRKIQHTNLIKTTEIIYMS